jgi:hypothetical protein
LHSKPLNFPNAKISEIEEKEGEEEPVNNQSENEDLNAALEAEFDDEVMEE